MSTIVLKSVQPSTVLTIFVFIRTNKFVVLRGMYDLSDFGTDDKLWQLIALCAGTGGSILVIGSASGVALMGLEKVDFVWYLKNVSLGATVGYFAGIATYLTQYAIMNGSFLNSLLPQAAVAANALQQATTTIIG
jgi:Na+/H+ antiporter NhaD/arsenite permease-like protein